MKDNISFYCLGAVHTDIKAHSLIRPSKGESVPVKITTCPGGVACNIAVNLAHCGGQVALASLVGCDQEGHALIEALRLKNINTQNILISKLYPTAKYYALLTPEGELFVAMADMNIYEELKPELINPLIAECSHISDWIIDANILGPTIKIVAQNIKKHQRLWGVGVSAHKTKNLRQGFGAYHGLIINQEELRALTGIAGELEAIQALKAQGCFYVVVTLGALGVYYADDKNIRFQEPRRAQVLDVTGAGDAFSAGVIFSLAHGQDFEEALEKGFSLAAKAMNSRNSCLL